MKIKYNDKQHAYWLDGKRCKSVTAVAKIPDNTYYLDLWQKRQVAIGLASEPRLLEQVAAHLADREKLDTICEQAQRAAKAHYAADAGTTAHRFTEVADSGQAYIETELSAQTIKAWNAALEAGGYEVVEGMVERIAVLPDHRICGTFDRILRRKRDGRLFIADLKTGEKAIDYPHSIAVQLAVYANANLLAGPLNGKGETTEFKSFPEVNTSTGIVIHMPTPDRAELVEFNIYAGWECFRDVILPTLEWRDRKDLTKVVTVEHQGSAAPVTPEAGEPVTPASDHRQWLIARIKNLDDKGRKILAAQWPDSVPTFKQADTHTEQQLAWIEQAIIKAEAEVDAPFPPENPAKVRPITPRHTPADPFDGLAGQAWDEGGNIDPDEVAAFRSMYEDLTASERLVVDTWAQQCHKDGNRSLSLKQKATRWRWTVLCALLHAARVGCDDDGLRELAYGATGDPYDLKFDVGLVISTLTIAEADQVAHLARHLGTDALVLTFSDKGIPSFSGPAYDPPPAA